MLPHMKQLSLVVLITLAVHKINSSHSRQIDVIRGEQDVFTNPKCLGGINQVRCSDCQGLNAVCVNNKNCSSCRCNGNNRTFVSTRGKYGQCVANEYLLYVTSYNSSFLVQEKDNKMCLYQYKPKGSKFRFVQVTDSCNYSISSQRWIWNRNGQLINTDTLECLEEEWPQENFFLVLLQRCNLNKKKQLWRCKGERSYYFSQQDSGRYMNHGNYYGYVTSYSNISNASKWRRFGTNQSLCSQAVGCERFIDGSALIILDKTKKREIVEDIGQKEIALDKKNNNCSILQEQTQYLHQDIWKSLSLKDNIFKIFTSEERTFLKWNLNKTPETWKLGIIVKLNFRCKTGNTDEGRQNIHQTHCILIKFKPNITGFQSKPTGPMQKKDDGSSNTIVIVSCIIAVAVLAITAVIGVLLYKRRKTRLSQPAESNITDHGQKQSSTLVMECEESLNPLYSTNTTGSSHDCQLYESNPDNLYHYIDKDHKSIPKPLQNTTYDYAINDGPRNTAGQWSIREVPDNNSAEGNNVVSQNASDRDPENKEKDRRFVVKEEVPEEQLKESDNGTKMPEPLPKYHVLEEQ